MRIGSVQTYLEDIKRGAGLRRQGVRVHPHVGEAGHVELAQAVVREADLEGDVVLHGHGEAVAEHGGGPEALEQLLRQEAVVLVLLDGILEEAEELGAGAVHGVALLDGDALGLVPGELAQSRDHALEGALWAIAREGGLVESKAVSKRAAYLGGWT